MQADLLPEVPEPIPPGTMCPWQVRSLHIIPMLSFHAVCVRKDISCTRSSTDAFGRISTNPPREPGFTLKLSPEEMFARYKNSMGLGTN